MTSTPSFGKKSAKTKVQEDPAPISLIMVVNHTDNSCLDNMYWLLTSNLVMLLRVGGGATSC